jgi:hypothetical protein
VALARRERDRVTYAAAFLALSDHAEAEQESGHARRLALRAFRSACRAGKAGGTEHARAAYRLFHLARRADAGDASHRYAIICTRRTLRGVELESRAILDLAQHWLAHRRGNLTRRLLQRLATSHSLTPSERVAAAVLHVRVEAAARAITAARRHLADALALAAETVTEDGPRALASLLQLARSAARLGEREALARVAKLALTHAPPERYEEVSAALRRLEPGAPLPGAA